MAVATFALVQSDGTLYRVAPDGTVGTINLPSGVTVSTLRPIRARVFNKRLILTNGVSRNVQLDINQVARLLTPRAPNAAIVAAVGAAGNLTGGYTWKYSFAIMDGDVVLAESELSAISNEIALTADQASLTGIATSVDPHVNARRIYRTSSDGGSQYYLVTTLYDNSTTSYTDNTTDEETSSLPVEPSLGAPAGTIEPTRLALLEVWKDRLWAVPDTHPDRVHFSGNRIQYGWNADYYFVAGAEGQDMIGVTAIVARRNELFVAKRRSLHKITGDTLSNFGLTDVPGGIGVWAPESAVRIRDEVYFLAEDGVYRWDGTLTNLSRDQVHPWFTEPDTFNLELLDQAFGHYNQKLDTYELYLASANSLVLDRWVSFDLRSGQWLGPHKTDAYTPSCAGVLDGEDGRQRPAVGATNGSVLLKNADHWQDVSTPIAMSAITNPMHGGDVEHFKVWGELETHHRGLGSGTLTVGARVGDLEAMTGPVAVISVERVGSTVTVLTNGVHYFGTGDVIEIAGATEVDYNGLWLVTRTGSTSFTYDIGAAVPATPANGVITALLPIREDQAADLTLDRHRLGRLGVGRYAQLSFANAEANQAVHLRGFTVHEVNRVGRR